MIGKLYLLEANGLYKIGITTSSVAKRVASLQTGNPYLIRKVFSKACGNYREMEKYFHRRYKSKRLMGEWFALTPMDVEAIKNCKKYSIFRGRYD